jgi:hypothetical protein
MNYLVSSCYLLDNIKNVSDQMTSLGSTWDKVEINFPVGRKNETIPVQSVPK